MDIKIAGVTCEIMRKALDQAKRDDAYPGNHEPDNFGSSCEISFFAPKILTIKSMKRRLVGVIGTGGKTIKGLAEQTGAEIIFENVGTVTILVERARLKSHGFVKSLVEDP